MTSPADMSPDQVREHAYTVWRESGQSLAGTVRQLKDEGFAFTRQTIAKWRDQFDWRDRAARAEVVEREQNEICSETGILQVMTRQIQRYADYFDSLPAGKMDNQAGFAFVSLCNSVLANMRKVPDIETPAGPRDVREINTPQDAIDALGEAIQSKINLVLSDPDSFDLKMGKDLKGAMELLDDLKARYKTENKSRTKGLPAEVVEQIKAEIMGISI